jgi:hypothetical protein
MTGEEYGALVLALLGVALLAALPGWTRVGRVIWPPFSTAVLLAALAIAGGAPHVDLADNARTAVAVALAGALAVVGGGPVIALLFRLVDGTWGDSPDPPEQSGLWIGVLERLAVFVSLVAAFPAGIAIALAVKSIGLYPQLRAPGTGERFVIGTFASVLWATACAGVILLAD